MFDVAKLTANLAVRPHTTIRIELINGQFLLGHFEEVERIIKERNIDIFILVKLGFTFHTFIFKDKSQVEAFAYM